MMMMTTMMMMMMMMSNNDPNMKQSWLSVIFFISSKEKRNSNALLRLNHKWLAVPNRVEFKLDHLRCVLPVVVILFVSC